MATVSLRNLAIAALLAACGAPVHAQNPVVLRFADGRVSVSATDVPMRTLLQQWGQLGQTRIVNLDRASTASVTVVLENVPEAEALAIIMRSGNGYMAAPRAVLLAGASSFDRILVMPPGRPPAESPAKSDAPRAAGTAAAARPRPGRRPATPANEPMPRPNTADTGVDAPFGQPMDNPFQANPFLNAGQPSAAGQPTPFGTPVPPGPMPPPLFGPVDASGGGQPVTQNPFLQLLQPQPSGTPAAPAAPATPPAGPSNGLGGATRPGVVMPTTPPATNPPARPPGGA